MNPALASTFWDATFSWEVAARSVRSPVPRCRDLAQLPDGRGRHAAAGGLLRDPVAEGGRAVLEVVEVEPAQNRAIIGDEHVEGAGAGLLVSQHGAMPAGKLVEELVTAIGDRSSEIGAVRQFEGQDRGGMASIQLL